jgi:hypothetical protein
MRHIAQMSHTAHTTRLYKCCTQSVQLNKHSAKKKKSCMYLRGDIDDNCLCWQCQCDCLDWAAGSLSLTHCCSHCLRWQWEHHCCIQNSKQCDHITCSYCNTHWNVLTYNDILKRVSYCMSDSWYNWQKSTHSDSESELHWCTMNDEFSFDSVWYIVVQTEHSHWAAQWWLLSEKSECTEWAAADQQRELNQHQHSQEQEWQCTHVKNEGSVSCQLWDTYSVQHLHCCCCWCCCCWACCMRVSADIFNQERFHIQKLWVKKLKKKEKEVVCERSL